MSPTPGAVPRTQTPRRLARARTIEDVRRVAHSRLPRAVLEYVEGGAYAELTLRRNRDDLAAAEIEQRVLNDVSSRSTEATIFGRSAALPFGLSPTGLAGLTWPNAEVEAARAARSFGLPCTISTLSVASIEDVADAAGSDFWFQLYLLKDRGFLASMMQRARALGCEVLVLTLDLHVRSLRLREIKYGLSVPPRPTLWNLYDLATHPAWALRMMHSQRRCFGNLIDAAGPNPVNQANWIRSQLDDSADERVIGWIRSHWPGRLVLKGVMHPDDARAAARLGADAILVSNHGGRQLDGAPSTFSRLAQVRDATPSEVTVFIDGGIRSGFDMLKCLQRGASACFSGRTYLYGLAAGGEAGVRRCVEILKEELDCAMGLAGVRDLT